MPCTMFRLQTIGLFLQAVGHAGQTAFKQERVHNQTKVAATTTTTTTNVKI